MAAQKFINNFTAQFVSPVATGDTVLRLPSSATPLLGTLTGGDWMILTAYKLAGSIESNVEVVKVTNVDPNSGGDCLLTVTRAQEGTTALAYVSGDYISLRLTSGGLNALASDAELATHTGNTSNPHAVTKAQVGLGNADNTSDANKPVSTATQTALNLKANLASPTFTGTVAGVTAAMVGAPSGSGTSSGTNTGDETTATIKTKLGITTLSGSNTGDQVLPTLGSLGAQAALVSGTNIKTVGGASLLGSGDIGAIPLTHGGTGATTASGATTALNRGRSLRESPGGTLVVGAHYSIYTAGGAVSMNLPAHANTVTGDRIDFTNLYLSWSSTNTFTIVRPAGTEVLIQQLFENLVCDARIGGFSLVCTWHDATTSAWNVV